MNDLDVAEVPKLVSYKMNLILQSCCWRMNCDCARSCQILSRRGSQPANQRFSGSRGTRERITRVSQFRTRRDSTGFGKLPTAIAALQFIFLLNMKISSPFLSWRFISLHSTYAYTRLLCNRIFYNTALFVHILIIIIIIIIIMIIIM
jgi:hypothetical protein